MSSSSLHILGISTPGHDASVALLDESPSFALEEEKLTRLQETSHVPRLALQRCLEENHLKLSDCRAIALAEASARNNNRPRLKVRNPPRPKTNSANSCVVALVLRGSIIIAATPPAPITPPASIQPHSHPR